MRVVLRPFLSRAFAEKEAGQALVLFAGGLVLLVALVGLSVDVGMLVYTRTDLQKAADAAALAGAQDLPANPTAARSAASTYIDANGGSSCASGCITVSTTSASNDTIAVTATRRVNYTFLKVLGLSGSDVSATAKVKVAVVTGYAFDEEDVFPYAVWGGPRTTGSNTCPYNICEGSTQVYRANNYQASSHAKTPAWAVNSNNFKGYFHHGTDVAHVNPSTWQTFSSGGNAVGQEPTDALDAHIASGEPILVPVISEAHCTGGCNDIDFKIVAWVALRITSRGNASQPWSGTVVANYGTPYGSTSGPVEPPAELATRMALLVE